MVFRVEALAITVSPRTARHDVGGLGTHRLTTGSLPPSIFSARSVRDHDEAS